MLLLCLAVNANAVTERFIDPTATGAANGTSWTDAWTTFSAALTGSVTPAATDTVIVWWRNGTYIENNSGMLQISQSYTNMVTFRHDENQASISGLITGLVGGASSNDTPIRVAGHTRNITFEDLNFASRQVVVSNADSNADFNSSADLTLTVNTTTFYEGTGSLNLTKTGTLSIDANAAKEVTSRYYNIGSNMSFSIYIKDAATLAKLVDTNSIVVRVGSDENNYFEHPINKANLTADQWNHIKGQRTNNQKGSPTLTAIDYFFVGVRATSTATTWSNGDILIDRIMTNAGSAFTLNYSAVDVDVNNLVFKRVTFDQGDTYGYAPFWYNPNNTTGSNDVRDINFEQCNFLNATTNTAAALSGINITASKTTNHFWNLVVKDSNFSQTGAPGPYGIYLNGAPNFLIQNVRIVGGVYTFNIPLTQATQATLGTSTWGTIENSYFESTATSGHAAVIGTNLNDGNQIIIRNNHFVSPKENGVVFKGSFNVLFEKNTIETRTSGGSAIMFKGCATCVAQNNYVVAKGSGLGGSDDSANWKNQNTIHRLNRIKVVGPTGSIFSFSDNGNELGGNLVNQNTYDVNNTTASSPFGRIGADSTLVTLAEARTAWADYNASYATHDSDSNVAKLTVSTTLDSNTPNPVTATSNTGITGLVTVQFASELVTDVNLQSITDFTGELTCTNANWANYKNQSGSIDRNYSATEISCNSSAQTVVLDINVAAGTQTNTLSFDTNKPTATWDGNAGWQTTDANLHLTCIDGNSGCSTTKYRIDSDTSSAITWGTWQTYDSNVLISTDANTAIQFYSTDVAGNDSNTGEPTAYYAMIDKTAPTTTINPVDGAQNPTEFQITCVDPLSGCSTIKYRINSGVWTTYSSAVSISGNGTWTIDYNGTDSAGNIETTHTATYQINPGDAPIDSGNSYFPQPKPSLITNTTEISNNSNPTYPPDSNSKFFDLEKVVTPEIKAAIEEAKKPENLVPFILIIFVVGAGLFFVFKKSGRG